MQYFDAHTHMQFTAYDTDRDEVIKRAQVAGVGMNIVGTQYDTSVSAVTLAQQHDDMYATVGLHPTHTAPSVRDKKELGESGEAFVSTGEVFDYAKYAELAANAKVIAIGECGLDYFRCEADTEKPQKEAFIAQIELANTLNKPLMLHIRDQKASERAYVEVLALLRNHSKVLGDVHFFASTWDIAKEFLDLGFTLSFNGVLTFTHEYDDIVRDTPLDMLLSETDAPYITPVPYRGQRNEPVYVCEVVKKIADIRNQSHEMVAEMLLNNSRRVFNIV